MASFEKRERTLSILEVTEIDWLGADFPYWDEAVLHDAASEVLKWVKTKDTTLADLMVKHWEDFEDVFSVVRQEALAALTTGSSSGCATEGDNKGIEDNSEGEIYLARTPREQKEWTFSGEFSQAKESPSGSVELFGTDLHDPDLGEVICPGARRKPNMKEEEKESSSILLRRPREKKDQESSHAVPGWAQSALLTGAPLAPSTKVPLAASGSDASCGSNTGGSGSVHSESSSGGGNPYASRKLPSRAARSPRAYPTNQLWAPATTEPQL
ncbi:unnamed protein product [Chrysoparadoxa australica]